ncbi:MAG: carbon-nitrogen family hydrolase [Verrucomicrobiales bacterium]|nr:carbon-nitrogen family hydrolase [Verrucomicrobiales bacterium]
MQLHCCQLAPLWEDRPPNCARVRALVDQTNPARGSLVVLPEMFATGFSMNIPAIREGMVSESTTLMGDLAKQYECCVLGGMVHGTRGGLFNQALAMSPMRRELVRYSKLHLFSPLREEVFITPGAEVMTFDWEGFRVAPFICYDLRFPESFRQAVLMGATLFTILANWPSVRLEHWITLLKARAIENQAYVVGVNRCGADPHAEYPGHSLVISPRGEILGDAGTGEGVLTVEITPEEVARSRAQFPALRDARF